MEQVTELDIKKKEEKSKKDLNRMLKKVDKELRQMEFQVAVEFGNIMLALTDRAVGNHKLVDFGICGQKLNIQKVKQCLQANICGITVDTYYSFERIAGFGTLLQDSATTYAKNMAVQMSFEQYKKFIKDIEKVRSIYPDYSDQELDQVNQLR